MCFKLYWLVTLTDFKMTNFLTIFQKKEIFNVYNFRIISDYQATKFFKITRLS